MRKGRRWPERLVAGVRECTGPGGMIECLKEEVDVENPGTLLP